MNMQQLADYRIRCGIKMTALAKEMGVTKGYINNIEKGNTGNKLVSEEEKQRYAKSIHSILNKRVQKDK